MQADIDRVRAAIEKASGSDEQLRKVFLQVVNQFGNDRASQIWWAVFAANDATET